MPRNVRNFWIELDVDGSKSRVETGPRSKDGGFDATVKMRDGGSIIEALDILGRADENGTLTLRIRPAGIASINGSPLTGDILIECKR